MELRNGSGGGGGGSALTVTDGVTTITNTSQIFFTSGATVTNGGGGIANVAIAGGSNLTIGTTTIASGTTTRILYDNAGVLGEYIISGSGNVAMTTSPIFTTPNIGSATGSISGNAGTATALATGRTISISGDLSYTSPSFDGTGNVTAAGTLATVNSNVGSFTNASITVNGKGLITAASSGTAPVTAVSGTTNRITSTGGATPVIDISATFEALLGKVASPLSQFASTTSAQLAGIISDETGSGALVFATSPTLVTPTLGVASATTINKVTITAPATGSTLTIADGKTVTANVSPTFSGADQTFTGSGTATHNFQNETDTLLGRVGSDRKTAQTAAVNLATYTVGASDASYLVSANVLVTTSTVHAFTVTCSYTDEGNTARVLTLQFSSLAGAMVTSIANAAGAVPYEGAPLHIRAKAGTTIIIGSAAGGTYTTVTYNIEENITKLG